MMTDGSRKRQGQVSTFHTKNAFSNMNVTMFCIKLFGRRNVYVIPLDSIVLFTSR
jgi:hypothetical protein